MKNYLPTKILLSVVSLSLIATLYLPRTAYAAVPNLQAQVGALNTIVQLLVDEISTLRAQLAAQATVATATSTASCSPQVVVKYVPRIVYIHVATPTAPVPTQTTTTPSNPVVSMNAGAADITTSIPACKVFVHNTIAISANYSFGTTTVPAGFGVNCRPYASTTVAIAQGYYFQGSSKIQNTMSDYITDIRAGKPLPTI